VIELFRCHRLDASISKRTCEINRARKTDIYKDVYSVKACEGCSGLGGPVTIDLEATVAKKICSVDGCSSVIHARGMCWKHERSVLGVDPNTGKPISKAGAIKITKKATKKPAPHPVPAPKVVKEIPSCPECGVIPCACFDEMGSVSSVTDRAPLNFGGVAQVEELNAMIESKRLEWIADLYGCTTERSRAKVFLAMVGSIEGLVYQ
jgi:hypothetical protein